MNALSAVNLKNILWETLNPQSGRRVIEGFAGEEVMNAIAPQQTAEIVPADASSVMAIIDRAARDPSIDIEKLERLMAMHERLQARSAEQSFSDAMNLAQAELRPVAANADNPQTRSKYASYPALDREVRPVYSRHGFSLSFNTADGAPADHIRVACKVRHRDGHTEPYHVDMPADGKGAKGGDVMTKTHAAGAAMSYGQRYLLKLIFNIAVGEDTDGNDPRAGERVTTDEAAEIQALMEDVGANRDAFLNYMRSPSISEIPASKYRAALAALEKKRGR